MVTEEEEFDEMWRRHEERTKRDLEELSHLSPQDRKLAVEEAYNDRFWEDWTDIDPKCYFVSSKPPKE